MIYKIKGTFLFNDINMYIIYNRADYIKLKYHNILQ